MYLKLILTSSLTSLVRSSFESFVLARFFTRHLTFLCENIYLGITICSVRFATFIIPVVLWGKVSDNTCSVLYYLRVFVQHVRNCYPLKLPSPLKTTLDNIPDLLDVCTSFLLLKYFFFTLANKFCVMEPKRENIFWYIFGTVVPKQPSKVCFQYKYFKIICRNFQKFNYNVGENRPSTLRKNDTWNEGLG